MQSKSSFIIGLSKTGLFDEFESDVRDKLGDSVIDIRRQGNGAYLQLKTHQHTSDELIEKIESLNRVRFARNHEQLQHS